MTDNHNNQSDTTSQPKKKISLQEAMKQKFAQKNHNQAYGNPSGNAIKPNQSVKSQQTKKRTNQRSRRGV